MSKYAVSLYVEEATGISTDWFKYKSVIIDDILSESEKRKKKKRKRKR